MSGELVVLGAAEEQIPIYREARRRGVRAIAVDFRRDRPALPFADGFLHCSIRDADAIAEALGDTRPAGIVSAASDAGLSAWHELCVRYGTPYVYPREAVAASMDKAAFHEVARAAGVDGYRWVCSADPDELAVRAALLDRPLVVKPADGSGSKGVRRVADPAGLPAAIAHAKAYASGAGVVIVEEVVQGRQLVVETFMRGGAAHFTAVLEKTFVPDGDFVVRRLRCPALVHSSTAARLASTAERLCRALGITDGPANFDVVLPPYGRERVIEVNARLGGNGIPRLLSAAYGVDVVAALVSLVLGEPFDLTPAGRPRHALLELLGSPLEKPGEFVAVNGLDDARASGGVADLELFAGPGDIVDPFDQSGHKIGHIVSTGESAAAAEQALDTAVGRLRLDVRPVLPSSEAAEGEHHVVR
ncbi:ATP-grasp domain-containing protein [Spirillospora sp. NPDC048911]|uniref:ATP-grasp domain-containing protein n=1 Tax=Spirillospora sp. NPDC048911 TaxID=3364527 RepID=UPI003712CB74